MTSRSIEIEVPGTPEEVWEAIATGPGIECWFVPAEVDGREGGTIVQRILPLPGWDSVGRITHWDPPRRFAAEERDFLPDGAPFATEFLVEARSGGTCVVRIVSSMASTGEDWEDELYASLEAGWAGYLHNLLLYRTHYPGERCSTIMATGEAPGPSGVAWRALADGLGLDGAPEQARVATAPGAPRLSGSVERVQQDAVMLRLEEPGPGYAWAHAFGSGDAARVTVHAYLFGETAPAVAAREEPAWRAWMAERFPTTT